MGQIKLEILLDTEISSDQKAFLKLMQAFSGTNSGVQTVHNTDYKLPVDKFIKSAVEAGVRAETNTEPIKVTTEIAEYSEAEMLKMPNTDLKEYATGLGIDWAKAEGKNTNRKLTDLILAFREGKASPEEEQETNGEAESLEEAETLEEENSTETTKQEDTDLLDDEDLAGKDLAGKEITYNDLKISLGKKVDDHRPKIVAELAKYGAAKMPALAEEHWEKMYNFLESL